ncbi:hypothetical protein BIFANG_02620 [Bifidobacterium angulatum DSM 20098 = JCM 7096]|uniref:Uncharacterized protein n=1 Tax=Bifidobacterium angulatum DSM 20098 = JCM 7096 TaxID=518635 RepID=C4FE80_9BIFI|nr:hypothetical protein BIFANG_02620 [Bifidobacterium angulatum DSM 20098 = JCM 7096]BAQ96168.1 hypothetical protein BBAG_0546 [Bifidobacterium angulatum DSM 20098 = JCM 7096]
MSLVGGGNAAPMASFHIVDASSMMAYRVKTLQCLIIRPIPGRRSLQVKRQRNIRWLR